jgi:hypothetical protein
MKNQELQLILDSLDINQSNLSVLLDVNIRTVRRWIDKPEVIPAPVCEALRAWLKLWINDIPWMPKEVSEKEVVKTNTIFVREKPLK